MTKATVKHSRKAVKKVARKKSTLKTAENTMALPKIQADGVNRPEVCDGKTKDWLDVASQATGVSNKSLAGKLILDAVGTFTGDSTRMTRPINHSLAIMNGIKPRDEVEAMLVTQMIGCHNATIRCMRNVACEGQTVDGVSINVNRSAKLIKAFTTLVDTLNRYRTKGQQKIKVEHVTVQSGGQAVVGDIHHRGGGGNGEK